MSKTEARTPQPTEAHPSKSKRTPATTVDEYLELLPPDIRKALGQLRQTIKSAAPRATEGISYQIPTFKQEGPLVGFAAFKGHCSFYVMSPEVLKAYESKVEGYVLGKGTIQFTAEKPLPDGIVKAIVKARLGENMVIASRRKKRSA